MTFVLYKSGNFEIQSKSNKKVSGPDGWNKHVKSFFMRRYFNVNAWALYLIKNDGSKIIVYNGDSKKTVLYNGDSKNYIMQYYPGTFLHVLSPSLLVRYDNTSFYDGVYHDFNDPLHPSAKPFTTWGTYVCYDDLAFESFDPVPNVEMIQDFINHSAESIIEAFDDCRERTQFY